MGVILEPTERLPLLHRYDYSRWLTDDYEFREENVLAVLDVAAECVHTMSTANGVKAGDPFTLLEWQIYQLIVPVFGIVHKKSGYRRFRRVLFYVPRKNGKSGIMSFIMIYMLGFDAEARPMGFSIAKNKKQAGIVWEEAALMIEKSPFLKPLFKVKNSLSEKSIICYANDGFYTVLSHDSQDKDGLNAHFVSGDEIQQYNLSDEMVVNLLHTSTSTRTQPLEFYFGTMGVESANDPFWSKMLAEGEAVLVDPLVDPGLYPLIFRAPEGADIHDEETWKIANPSLGPIKTYEYMRQESAKAKLYPANEGEFKRLDLNIKTSSSEDWIPKPIWQACESKPDEFDLKAWAAARRPCYLGIDLSATRDFTAIGMCFAPHGSDVFWRTKAELYLPEATLVRRQAREKKNYLGWLREKFFSSTPGDVIDKDIVFDRIVLLCMYFNVKGIAFDDWNNRTFEEDIRKAIKRVYAEDPAMQDEAERFFFSPRRPEDALFVNWRQGFFSMTQPTKEFEIKCFDGAKDKSGGIKHDGNPILEWMVGCVVITEDAAGNKKPDKAKSTNKIDGVVAEIMAFGLALTRMGGALSLEEHILSEDYSN